MLASPAAPPAAATQPLQNRTVTALALLAQVAAALVFLAVPFLGFRWLRGPAELPAQTPFSFGQYTQALGVADLLAPYITGLVYLVCVLYVYSILRKYDAGRAFALFAAAAAVTLGALFDAYTTARLLPLWTVSVALCAGALVDLALIFPKESGLARRYPFLRGSGYAVALGLALFALLALAGQRRPATALAAWRLEVGLLGLAVAVFIASTAARRFKAPSPIVRDQARLVLTGALAATLPLALWVIVSAFSPSLVFTSYWLLPLAIFPVVAGYTILRYRLLSSDYLINKAILYALLSGLAIAGYALLVSGLSLIAGGGLRPNNPYVIGLMVFLLALFLNPVRNRLQQAVDAVFFRGQVVLRSRLQLFGYELTQALDLAGILALLRQYAGQGLQPAGLHIFVHDPLSDYYVAAPDEQGAPTTDLRFPATSPLVQALSQRHDPLYLGEGEALPQAFQPEQARLGLLGSQLFVPLPGRQKLIGWLALGPRRSGEPYTSQSLGFLESLADQAALAVERAQVVADLERRVREMNVLGRVAQGANFTINFDDILELVYTQTSQVIPSRDCRVVLHDKATGGLYYAFYLEDDERVSERENHPIAARQGLEPEVIASQRSLMTDDYERECRARGCLPEAKGIYAWLGVPLNAGAETIGAISLGNRDPAGVFTEEQRSLLQAIADQAAGSIVKARLLQETERRARQLATLNEIGRGLTSTLEPKPLLRKILESATEILNCEAGSLFLVDAQTGDLVFEVVLGPVASDLTGQRLPPGKGLAWEAVTEGKAIIANDAKRRKEWFDGTDHETGFDTQDLLVVPMQVQERCIGVIEVINKRDGAPFNQSDQELLTTFTSQATIAIENARLYTLTDQALAARVEELSVMQRIDRELNASLDIQRAMDITLDWAMRQSHADAGLVGILEDGCVRVMTSQGYDGELAPYQSGTGAPVCSLPAGLPSLQAAVETGQPQRRLLMDGSVEGGPEPGLLVHARSQAVIPIRREADVIGLLLLESAQPEPWQDEMLAFLSRLSDHAAIAIANAQLYNEVQAANLAKSKFVSFVAHELKNPMASIKGYTELVAGGMAGPVNDMQASFLATVRSNVDRMNTIVSDLNDLTKIQVGSLRLEFKAVQIIDVLDEVIRSIRRQIDEKEQRLELALLDSLPFVWGDPSRLTQILTNLVSNAYKYTPKGGTITVGAETCRVVEGAPGDMDVVHVWVADSGIGIPEEDQDKIFQQYFRTDISKEAASGTGLGLNITKSLVEMQGGRIWFESELDQGTTFHITVPVTESS